MGGTSTMGLACQAPELQETVYVAGPMSGHADWNFPAFHAAAEDLRTKGYSVLNPADNDGGDPCAGNWQYFLAQDIQHILVSDLVVVLPGWRQSRGATFEVMLAVTLGKPVLHFPSLKPVKDSYAFKWVCKPRGLV